MSTLSIIIITIVSAVAVLFGITSMFLYIRSRKHSVRISELGDSMSEGEVTLSPEYISTLEQAMRKEFQGVIQEAASNMQEGLQDLIREVIKEGEDLSKTLEDFEERFSEDFEIATKRLETRLSEEVQNTIQEVQKNDKRLVDAVQSLSDEAESNFRTLLARAWEGLDEELEETRNELKEDAKEMIISAFRKEAEEMRSAIAEARNNTINSLSNVYKDVEEKKKALEAQAEEEAQEYKRKRIQQFEDRMDEVVSQFLIENAGKAFDLDKQNKYILEILEENKEKLKKDING